MKLGIIHIASFIAMFQASFIGGFLLHLKKGRQRSNLILSAILFAFTLIITSQVIMSSRTFSDYYKPGHLLTQVAFLIGPLLYFYIKSLTVVDFSFKKYDFLHFLPFVFAAGLILVRYQVTGKVYIFSFQGTLFRALIIVQNFIYFIATVRLLKSAGLSLKTFFSYAEDFKVSWLRFFVIGCFVIWICQFFVFLFWDVLNSHKWCIHLINLYLLSTFIFFNTVVYILLRKSDFFLKEPKYKNSFLKDSDKNRFFQRLENYMDNEKPYLNPSLSLLELSLQLSIPMRYLSQVINEHSNQNFFDYINHYRIQESKNFLRNGNRGKKTILEIAYAVGFNSKSTFNAAFKKQTGLTPREFKKKVPGIS